jgi:hypothetical protein
MCGKTIVRAALLKHAPAPPDDAEPLLDPAPPTLHIPRVRGVHARWPTALADRGSGAARERTHGLCSSSAARDVR